MVETQKALHGKVLLTITDSKGNVVLHETVRPEDVEIVSANVLASIR